MLESELKSEVKEYAFPLIVPPFCPGAMKTHVSSFIFFMDYTLKTCFCFVLFFIIDSKIGMREAHFESIFLILGSRNSK